MAFGVALAGAAAGAEAGNLAMGNSSGSGNDSAEVNIPDTISQMNTILNNSLGSALGASNSETNAAIAQQNSSLGQAGAALTGGNAQANSAVSQNVNLGTAENQALQAPYNSAGYQALDAYMGTLGLATPVGGSQALSQNLYNSAQLSPVLQNLQTAAAANGNANPYAAPTAPTLQGIESSLTPAQLQQYLASNNKTGQAYGNTLYSYGGNTPTYGNSNSFASLQALENNPAAQAYAASQLAQPLYQTAQSQYNAQNTAYNNVGNTISSLGLTPQALSQAAAYNNGSLSGVK